MRKGFQINVIASALTMIMLVINISTAGATSGWEQVVNNWSGINIYIGIVVGGMSVFVTLVKIEIEDLKRDISDWRNSRKKVSKEGA